MEAEERGRDNQKGWLDAPVGGRTNSAIFGAQQAKNGPGFSIALGHHWLTEQSKRGVVTP